MDSICSYFKFGHCKFGILCRKRHIETQCDSVDCSLNVCEKRHPKLCKYFQNYGRCKFMPCFYKHVEASKIEESRIEDLEKKVRVKDDEIKALKEEVLLLSEKLQMVVEKFAQNNDRLDSLCRSLNPKTPISSSAQHLVYGREQCSGGQNVGGHLKMDLSYVVDVRRDDPTRSLGAFPPGVSRLHSQ